MPPKRRAVASSFRGPSGQQQQPVPPIYANEVADEASLVIQAKSIIKERKMAIVPPQSEYIQLMGWRQFVEAVTVPASLGLVQEFYSNLAGQRADLVFVRGHEVNISPAAINAFYGLPDLPQDGYMALTQQSPLPSAVALILASANVVLPADWRTIERGLLNDTAKSWVYFVNACLMPISMGSTVHRVCALLAYAIMTHLTFDVGCVINRKMRITANARDNKAIGFPVLIIQLCQAAGWTSPRATPPTSSSCSRRLLLLYLPVWKAQRRRQWE